MADAYWHNLKKNNNFSDLRNYSSDSAGTTQFIPAAAVTAVDDAPAVGSQTVTFSGSTSNIQPGYIIFINNNAGLGVDMFLTVNAVAGSIICTVDEDITGIDVSGTIDRVSPGQDSALRFDGSGSGNDDDVHIPGLDLSPGFDRVNSCRITSAFKGRLRCFEDGVRKLIFPFGPTNIFSYENGLDRFFGGIENVNAGWTWASRDLVDNFDSIINVGPDIGSSAESSPDNPFIIPNFITTSNFDMHITRTDTSKALYVRAINDSLICDTPTAADDMELFDINVVMINQNGIENIDQGTVDLIGGTLFLGFPQSVFYSTDTVNADTVPTDKSQLWIPPIFFLHDWNSSFDISESYQTNIRTAVNIEETRRGVVEKPFRVINQDSQAWNDEDLLRMQSFFNRVSTARSLQPLFCDMSFLLNAIDATTVPTEQSQYPDAIAIPANGTVLVMDFDRLDIRYARFYKGMRVLIYNPVEQKNTRMIDDFEINSIVNVWGLYNRNTPDTFTTIWLENAVGRTWPVGTRVIPLIETDVVFNASAEVMNAVISNFAINNSETIGQTALPSIIGDDILTSESLNGDVGSDMFATWPISNGSAQAPAAPIITPDTANYVVNPTRSFFRPGQFAHIGKGNIPEIYGSRTLNQYEINATFITRKSAWEFITMWQSRRGQLNRAYVISPWEDYTATALDGVSCTINKNGSLIDFQVRQFISFKLNLIDPDTNKSYEWIIRRVTGLTDNGSTITLKWTEPLPEGDTVGLSDMVCVRSAFLARFSQDDCLQQWINLNTLEFTIGFQDLGPELDDDASAIAGLWAVDLTQGLGGYDVIKDTGAFTNTLDSITLDPDNYYGTMEEVVRAQVIFEIATNSTCIGTNVFWPIDETFEILKVVNFSIDYDGVSFIDIGMGENTGCTINNYDYDDFVIRIYLSFKEALWNRRDKGVSPADPQCPPPMPQDFTQWWDFSSFTTTPLLQDGTETVLDLVDTANPLTIPGAVIGSFAPAASMPGGQGLYFMTSVESSVTGESTLERSNFNNSLFTIAGYVQFAIDTPEGGNDKWGLFSQGTIGDGTDGIWLYSEEDGLTPILTCVVRYFGSTKTLTHIYAFRKIMHVAIVCRNTSFSMWVDGVKVDELTFGSLSLDWTGTKFTFGPVLGALSDWLRWDYALTDVQMPTIYGFFRDRNKDESYTIGNAHSAQSAQIGNMQSIATNYHYTGSGNATFISVRALGAGDTPSRVQIIFHGAQVNLDNLMVGFGSDVYTPTSVPGQSSGSVAIRCDQARIRNQGIWTGEAFAAGIIVDGDILDMTCDIDNNTIHFRLNGNDSDIITITGLGFIGGNRDRVYMQMGQFGAASGNIDLVWNPKDWVYGTLLFGEVGMKSVGDWNA